MKSPLEHIVIVGGGTAGWLTAAILAAEHSIDPNTGAFRITLIESPDISTIGVGEGTWPSMRTSLKRIGISETDFFRQCNASFKQGTQFNNWIKPRDAGYAHPFTLPQSFADANLVRPWQQTQRPVPFAEAVCPQIPLFERHLAPKQISTPEYACHLNYGYHLDAAKFADMLRVHAVEKLGITHLSARVKYINNHQNGDIASLATTEGEIAGDLFIDCSGARSLLLGEHFGIPINHKQDILFNDSAIAAQVPYASADADIASCTLSTAKDAGWIWDIGLPNRRGTGYVYSSAHTSEERAQENLRQYVTASAGEAVAERLETKKIRYTPGHREKFWHKNCVAIGMSAGFIEPLEASALVLVEVAATAIADHLPANRAHMEHVAKRFNDNFIYRWESIIDFLKLHYVLSQRRDSDYWQDHANAASIPQSLSARLEHWRHQTPWHDDDQHANEMFPSASYQYVLYGMGFETQPSHTQRRSDANTQRMAGNCFAQNQQRSRQLLAMLPSNRELIDKIYQHGMQTI